MKKSIYLEPMTKILSMSAYGSVLDDVRISSEPEGIDPQMYGPDPTIIED